MSAKQSIIPAIIAAVSSVIVAVISTGMLTGEIKRDVARLEAIPIGTIIASMLNETEFNDASEGFWVLADGRNIANSEYSKLTKKTNAPDLQGYFLRGMDIGSLRDPDGGTRQVGSSQMDAFQSHAHGERSLSLKGDKWQHSASPEGQLGHSESANKDSYDYLPTREIYEDNASGTIKAGVETRPKNIAVFYYIKIDSRK